MDEQEKIFQRKNRVNIINSKSINQAIDELFPDFVNFDPMEYLSHYPIEYKETEKFVIFVTGKGGSTITNRILEENDLSLHHLGEGGRRDDINNCFSSHGNFMMGYNESIPLLKEVSELKNILSGTSKKDLIIVTRNPIKKWMSGLVQELSKEIENSIVASSFLSETYGIVVNTLWDVLESKDLSDEIKSEILCDLSYKFLKMAIFRYGTTEIDHMQLYNEIFYLFLENNPKIDLSKVRIVDIDSDNGDLVELFRKYYPDIKINPTTEGFWSQRYVWNLISKNLKNHMLKHHRGIYEVIKRELVRDLHYYNLIYKNYKKNII